MPAERLSMRKLREFLRLHLEQHLTGRAIGRSLKMSPATAQSYMSRVRLAGLGWPLPKEFDSDEALTRVLFPEEACVVKDKRAVPSENSKRDMEISVARRHCQGVER